MTLSDIAIEWEADFPGVMPVGSALPEACPERWLRIHSFPAGKRYADDDAERAELLHRSHAVATALLRVGAPCAVVTGEPVDEKPSV